MEDMKKMGYYCPSCNKGIRVHITAEDQGMMMTEDMNPHATKYTEDEEKSSMNMNDHHGNAIRAIMAAKKKKSGLMGA